MDPNGLKLFKIALNGLKLLQKAPNGSQDLQKDPNDSKCLKMAPNGFKWLQITLNSFFLKDLINSKYVNFSSRPWLEPLGSCISLIWFNTAQIALNQFKLFQTGTHLFKCKTKPSYITF